MNIIQEYRKLGCPVTNCHNFIYDIQTWLREKLYIHINLWHNYQDFNYSITIGQNSIFKAEEIEEGFDTYEEALNEAIEYVLTDILIGSTYYQNAIKSLKNQK